MPSEGRCKQHQSSPREWGNDRAGRQVKSLLERCLKCFSDESSSNRKRSARDSHPKGRVPEPAALTPALPQGPRALLCECFTNFLCGFDSSWNLRTVSLKLSLCPGCILDSPRNSIKIPQSVFEHPRSGRRGLHSDPLQCWKVRTG